MFNNDKSKVVIRPGCGNNPDPNTFREEVSELLRNSRFNVYIIEFRVKRDASTGWLEANIELATDYLGRDFLAFVSKQSNKYFGHYLAKE